MDSTIIIGCGGGCCEYRLNNLHNGKFTIEQRWYCMAACGSRSYTEEEDCYTEWELKKECASSKEVWDWMGKELGWL